MRDLTASGLPDDQNIRTGQLYRSAHLDQLNEGELNNFASLGIRTVIDLRRQQEYSDDSSMERICIPIGDAKPDQKRFSNTRKRDESIKLGDMFQHLGIDSSELLIKWTCQNYREKIHVYRSEFVEAVKICIDPSRMPVLFHCIGGKDRTGILAALLLDLLGYSRSQILADYEETNQQKPGTNIPQPYDLSTLSEDLQKTLGHAHPEYLLAALNTIQEDFGSVENYLTEDTDITHDQLQTYRNYMFDKQATETAC